MKTTAPRRPLLFGLFALCLTMAGCGVSSLTTETSGPLVMNGQVHGGVQPITGASIQLFAVGTTGNGSQATSLLRSPVFTDAHSYFSITGDYSCPSASSQVYLVARGGNPGYAGNVNNPALVLLSALGNCGDLIGNPNRFISVNEVSTVAAAYALAQFTSSYDHVGASATNATGIANAFLDAQLLANPATGMAPVLPSNLSVETGKLYALADAIVPCVNSDGGTACNPLFTAATINSARPSDVLGALLNIVKNPGHNVAAVYNVIGSTPPYPSTLSAAPADWTLSLTVTGGGLIEPTQLALDKFGNVWVANYGDSKPSGLVAFSPQGTPFPGTPFGSGVQTESYALTVDKNGDVWQTSAENVKSGQTVGSVAKFHGASSSSPGSLVGQYFDATLDWPESIAADPSGNGTILIGNYVGGNVTIYDLNGNFLNNLGGRSAIFPVAITSDNAGGAWLGEQGYLDVVHVFANGTVKKVACCNAVQTVNLDLHGNVWATNFVGIGKPPQYTFSEVSPDGTILLYEKSGGGLFSPGSGAIDSAGQFWVANYYGLGTPYGSVTEIAGNDNALAAGTAISPSTGFGLDAKMSLAYALAPDASGNLWVTVRNGDSLRMFFGLAAPTLTPATPIPQAP